MGNLLREKLSDAVLEGIDAVHDMDVTHDAYAWSAADAIIAALPDMVKPLVWIEGGSDSFMHDADFVDTTQTYQIQEGLYWYAAEVQGVPCGSNEAAKAAANAHHVAQVLSTLGIN